MGRFVAEDAARADGFSVLMERLAQRPGLDQGQNITQRPDIDAAPERLERPGTDRKKEGASRTTGTARDVLMREAMRASAATNSAASRSKPAAEAQPLSYEDALRLHKRRSREPEPDLVSLSAPGRTASTASEPSRLADQPSRQENAPATRAAAPQPAAERPKAPAKREQAKRSAADSTAAMKAGLDHPQASSRTPSAKRHKRNRRGNNSTVSTPAAEAARGVQSESPGVPHPRRSARSPETASPRARGSGNDRQPITERAPIDKMARQSLQLQRLEKPDAGPEQRRVILSVRLSEEESDLLRERAAESGISVSAYMRSCVMEADHLRAQVKQALAQMRMFTRPPEPPQLPASIAEQRPWSRFLARSMTFFFGPWYPARRRNEDSAAGSAASGFRYGE